MTAPHTQGNTPRNAPRAILGGAATKAAPAGNRGLTTKTDWSL